MNQRHVSAPIAGAVAGFIATIPMTIFMRRLFKELPPNEKYPLPPRIITENLTKKIGIKKEIEKAGGMTPATWVSHFAFGTAAGLWYGLRNFRTKDASTGDGIRFAMKVYALQYGGTLPMSGLFPPIQSQPLERNALMVAAHVVWGATLGFLTNQLTRSSRDQ